MSKLLAMLIYSLGEEDGKARYEELKTLHGEGFEAFEALFEKDGIIVDAEAVPGSEVADMMDDPVLAEGWLSEDNVVDIDKINDESLKEVITGLQKAIEEVAKSTVDSEITYEAMLLGAIDPSDIAMYVDWDNLGYENRKYNGVKAEVERVKVEKPHLFTPDKKDEVTEGDDGFNPPKQDTPRIYQRGMSLAQAKQIGN